MKLTVKVDPQLCIGAASCVVVDADHFEINTEGKAEVLATDAELTEKGKQQKAHDVAQGKPTYELELEVDEAGKEKILDAARSCPTQAIFVIDEAGTQIFPS